MFNFLWGYIFVWQVLNTINSSPFLDVDLHVHYALTTDAISLKLSAGDQTSA